jgi:hypothetical protein
MAPSLTGEPRSVDDRARFGSALIVALAAVLVDEVLVLLSPRMPELVLASRGSELARLAIAAVALAAPLLALASSRRGPRPSEAAALVVLVAERTAASSSHRPWSPGGLEGAREALVAAASSVHDGVPWGGIAAFFLAFALGACAAWASSAKLPRPLSRIFVALTLLFATCAALVYASGAGESWFEPPTARTTAPCPAPRGAPEPPKEMQNGSENRDPK